MDFETAIKETVKDFQQSAQQERLMGDTQPEETVEVEEQVIQPVDLYQNRRDAMRQQPEPRVRGASKKLQLELGDLMENGIQQAYKKAVDDSESLREEGEAYRAELVKQQYMDEWYRPLVDALIRLNSQEEVLASQDALATLDALTLLPGGGRGDGYTSVYVSSLYEPVAAQTFVSDAEVLDGIRRINRLCDTSQMKPAISLAKKLMSSIDMGANRSTPEDYEFLQRIALRG